MIKITFILSLLPFFGFAQDLPLPIIGNTVVYEAVIKADSLTKDELYYRARRVLIDKFKNTKEGTYIDNKEDGILTAKGVMPYPNGLLKININYILELSVREGRYKYKIAIV